MEPHVSKQKSKPSHKAEEESSYSECMLAKVIAKLAVGEQYHDPEIDQELSQPQHKPNKAKKKRVVGLRSAR